MRQLCPAPGDHKLRTYKPHMGMVAFQRFFEQADQRVAAFGVGQAAQGKGVVPGALGPLFDALEQLLGALFESWVLGYQRRSRQKQDGEQGRESHAGSLNGSGGSDTHPSS